MLAAALILASLFSCRFAKRRKSRIFSENLRRELECVESPVPPVAEAVAAKWVEPSAVSDAGKVGAPLSCKWQLPGHAKPRYKLTVYDQSKRREVSEVRDYLDNSDGTVFVLDSKGKDFNALSGVFILEDTESMPRDSDHRGMRFRVTLVISGSKIRSWVTDRFSRTGNLYRIAPLYSGSYVLVRGECTVEEAGA